MKLQLMPPPVLGLAKPVGLPAGYVEVPVAAFLRLFLLTNVGFLCHGSSCGGEIDLQDSQKTMARRARPVKMGLI
jgi:hypothetical protein